MVFSEKEIELAKELKRLGFQKDWKPQLGQFIYARHCPAGCREVAEGVHLIIDAVGDYSEALWLPTFDDLLAEARQRKVSFSQITDFIHRRRYADKGEREGLISLFVEALR